MYKELKVELPEKQIKLKEHIKTIGQFAVEIELFKDIKATVSINVEPS